MTIPHPLAHAYLICGGNGESRRAAAEAFAAAYVCTGSGKAPCGVCSHCRKAKEHIHPDLITVAPEEGKQNITVDQIRALRRDAYVMPNEGARKVFTLSPADAMNDNAQNALLKVLEDGPDYLALLLTAESPGALLPTIRSRCETVLLPPEEEPPDPRTEEWAEKLSALLLTGTERKRMEFLVSMETGKWKPKDILAVYARTEELLLPALRREPKKVAPILARLRKLRETAPFNVGAGHLLGWLAVGDGR